MTRLPNETIEKIRAVSQKNFLLENIKKSKQSPEKKGKKNQGKHNILIENKADLSKTSFNMNQFNKENSMVKGYKKPEKLEALTMGSFKPGYK